MGSRLRQSAGEYTEKLKTDKWDVYRANDRGSDGHQASGEFDDRVCSHASS